MSDRELTISRQWSMSRVMILVMSVLGLGAAVAAVLTARDLRSSAQIDKPSPTPFVISTVIPSAKTALKTPFLRLASTKSSVGFSASIPIEVYLHTGGAATMEHTLVLSYNPDLLELNKADIKNEDIFKVLNATLDEPGKVVITVFVDTLSGQAPVTLDEERKILTINFKSKTLEAQNADLKIEYDKKNVDLTSLIEYSAARKDTLLNLLNSVEGLSLTIHP